MQDLTLLVFYWSWTLLVLVLFHRVANTLNYLDIRTVIVSCGTCMDQLLEYQFDRIFPGCRLLDIHEYLMERGVRAESTGGTQYLYHDPCHTPMKSYSPVQVASTLLGQPVTLSCRIVVVEMPVPLPSHGRTSRPRCAFANGRSWRRVSSG